MKHSRTSVLLVLFGGLMLSSTIQADEGKQQVTLHKHIAMPTMMVMKYSALEKELNTAVNKGDTVAIENLLAAHFEERWKESPNSPIPRAAWIKQTLVMTKGSSSQKIEQMAVKDIGSSHIVSYLLVDKAATKANPMFIVDVWSEQDGKNQLIARYRPK